MTVKQSTSFTDEAFAYAQTLVESGEFGSVSAAVSAALIQLREQRARETALFEAELLRRDALPAGEWIDWREGDLLAEYRARRDAEGSAAGG